MFSNPFSMVVAIVLIVSVAGILRARWGLPDRHDRRMQQLGMGAPRIDSAETERLRDEVKMLKDRVAVLERIATDNHEATRIDQEIAKLRDK
jgi:hypothetical protein